MNPEEEKINEALLSLINEHGLSAQDIADVIAEQVTAAKNSDNEKISYVARRLERKFGSKVQDRHTSANYNAKADKFGGYFLSFLLSISTPDNNDGIAIGLEALENAYEIHSAVNSNIDANVQNEAYINWYEDLGIVLSNEIQDEMYEIAWAVKDASDLMSKHQDRDSILNAAEKYKLAIKKGEFVSSKFLEKNVNDINSEHIVSAFYLMVVGQATHQNPLHFREEEIAHAHAATLALGVGAPEEVATKIFPRDREIIKLVIKWMLYHYPRV